MLRRSKHLLKKEKGVTLVELLAVIIILGIIALIAVPAIAGVIEDSKVDSVKSSAINYINAAELYAVTNDIDDGEVELETLRDDGYVNDDNNNWGSVAKVEITDGEGYLKGVFTGDVTITFLSASVEDINGATDVKDGGTIE